MIGTRAHMNVRHVQSNRKKSAKRTSILFYDAVPGVAKLKKGILRLTEQAVSQQSRDPSLAERQSSL